MASRSRSEMHPWLNYRAKAKEVKILVVGAGGIGCELLKNLVLAGFLDITILDLDTIDVTNLNRQFLFQKQHVGKSKALVAKESALRFNPDAKINAIHDSIMHSEYGVQFFKQFRIVMNALDNRAARSHVNRMCLAADVPLVESGTAGYLGQVTVIRKGNTECYECTPKPHQKTFPGCTIRNTPSEPIHCIVWAKHLFNQLFGEIDPDEEVSPDAEDPEAELEKKDPEEGDGNVTRVSTRQWAMDQDYGPEALFNKFFHDDIKYLLTMDKLWSKRRPPEPLKWNDYPEEEETYAELCDQTVWSIKHCAQAFEDSLASLKERLKALPENDHLVWDKDDDAAMNFVTACANIRSHVFHIAKRSRFDIKSMAGNIIPAIATTNAIIAGGIVLEGIKLLSEDYKALRTVYLTRKPNPRKKILVPCTLNPPNPKCYVCADKHEVSVKLNLAKMTLKSFEEKILKGTLSMVAPDVEIEGRGVILISSDGDTEENADKVLKDFNIMDGCILACDDFLQNFSLKVILYHSDHLEDDAEFELLSDVSNVTAAPETGSVDASNGKDKDGENGNDSIQESNGSAINDRKRKTSEAEVVIDGEDEIPAIPAKKPRKSDEDANNEDVICIEKLCQLEPPETSLLEPFEQCLLFSTDDPFSVLGPLKLEYHAYDPLVVTIHDALGEDILSEVENYMDMNKFEEPQTVSSSSGEVRKTAGRAGKVSFIRTLPQRINKTLSYLTGLSMIHSEHMQLVSYGVGGHYEPHVDYFKVGETAEERFASIVGDRIATMILYLNDPIAGGSTVFPRLGISVHPKRGSALLWYNLFRSGMGDPFTLHSGCPVLLGSKVIANQWFREQGQELIRPCSLSSDE